MGESLFAVVRSYLLSYCLHTLNTSFIVMHAFQENIIIVILHMLKRMILHVDMHAWGLVT